MKPNRSQTRNTSEFFSVKRLRELLIFCVLGATIGLVAWCFVPKHWRATMLVEVGQAGDGTPIADPSSVAAGMQFPSFAAQVVNAADIGPLDEAPGKLVKRSLSASVLRGAPLIEVSVEGYSREQAQHVLATVLSMLQQKHGALLAPATARRQTLLDSNKKTLAALETQRASVTARLDAGPSRRESAFSQSIVLTDLLHSIDGQVHELTTQTALLSEQLSAQKTFNTRIVSPIYSPIRPSSSPAHFYLVWGVLLGATAWLAFRLLCDAQFRVAFRHSVFGSPAHA